MKIQEELNKLALRRTMIQADSDSEGVSDSEGGFFRSDSEQDTPSAFLDKETRKTTPLSSILDKSKTSSLQNITTKSTYLGADYIAECIKNLITEDVNNAGGYDVITGTILEYLDDFDS